MGTPLSQEQRVWLKGLGALVGDSPPKPIEEPPAKGRKSAPRGAEDDAAPAAGPDGEPLLTGVRPFDIGGSVGQGGKNAEDDVRQVQIALNRQGAKVEPDGKIGPRTIQAIKAFQKKIGIAYPDGLIEVGKRTATALAGGGRGGGESYAGGESGKYASGNASGGSGKYAGGSAGGGSGKYAGGSAGGGSGKYAGGGGSGNYAGSGGSGYGAGGAGEYGAGGYGGTAGGGGKYQGGSGDDGEYGNSGAAGGAGGTEDHNVVGERNDGVPIEDQNVVGERNDGVPIEDQNVVGERNDGVPIEDQNVVGERNDGVPIEDRNVVGERNDGVPIEDRNVVGEREGGPPAGLEGEN